MTETQLIQLIVVGGADRARAHLKRLSIPERLVELERLVPYIKQSAATLRFFHQHFAKEIGALFVAGHDMTKAEQLYRAAKTESASATLRSVKKPR